MDREHLQELYAGLQATLHNTAGYTDKNGKPKVFTAEMWMPGYKAPEKPKADWKADKAVIERAMKRATPEDRRAEQEGQRVFLERQRRAEQAKADGEPPEKIRAIMRGEA